MFLGIDPGILGSFSLCNYNNVFIESQRIPVKITNGKNSIDIPLLVKILGDTITNHNPTIFLERVHAMPGNGSVSMFRFGEGYGILKGIIASHGKEWISVTPRTWQKVLLGEAAGDTKQRALDYVLAQLGGDLPPWLLTKRGKVDKQLIDAMCIAKYGSLYGKI